MNTHVDDAVRTRLITMACDNRDLGVRSGVRAAEKALRPHPWHGWVVSNCVLHSYCDIDQLPLSTSKSEANLRGWPVRPCCGGCCL